MERVAQGSTTTITETFDAEPGVTTVAAVNDAGNVVTVGSVTGTGTARSFTLSGAATASLDRLVVTWSTANLGTVRSTVEVVGGFFFSLADFKAISMGGATMIGTKFSDDQLRDMRTTVEDTLEHACGRAFVPRYSRATMLGDGTSLLRGLNPFVRTVRWARTTANGVATDLTVNELAGLSVNPAGFVTGGYTWSVNSLITVGYEHGMDEPPPRVRKAALLLAKTWIVSGPVDDRVTTMSSPDTGITAALAVPGRGGSIVGVPEVDAVINEYRLPAVA